MRSSCFLLLGLSLLLHFFWLGHPNEVVFDEVHWGKFISSYCCTGQNFFDVHPPHGKLLVAGAAKLANYSGDQDFTLIGIPYTKLSVWAIRALPALAGALVPIVVYFILLLLGSGNRLAFLGGWMMTLENGLLNQSRVMGLYPFLLLSLVLALYYLLKMNQSSGLKNCLYGVLAGISAGFAVGFQFTGLVALALILLVLFVRSLRRITSVWEFSMQSLVVFSSALCVYLWGWHLHFRLLTQAGPGDAFYRSRGNFWEDLISLHRMMYTSSYNLLTPHPDGSPWWSWPYMGKPIYYWTKSGSSIYFLGNPIVWWGISAAFAILVVWSLSRLRKMSWPSGTWISFAGFLIAFLPLTRLPRVLFLYHFLTPLTYALIFVFSLSRDKWVAKNQIYYGLILLTAIGFFWISPVTYGFPMPPWYWTTLPWNLAH